MVKGVTGIIVAALNVLLRGPSWSSLILPLLLSALNFLIGVKLLQRRYWALIGGRLLALSGAVGFVGLVVTGRLAAAASPIVMLEIWATSIMTTAIAIIIFLPSVGKAFPAPNKPESP
jgi:hypothetical protein